MLDVDPDRFAFTMEDLSDLVVLRTALDGGARFGTASLEVGDLVGRVTFATSVAGTSARGRAELLARSVNPLLAEVTEKYLLGDPFTEAEHNHHHPKLAAAVAALRADPAVRTEVAVLRAAFGSSAQALVHGDLHTGSVMVGARDGAPVVRVIDPEFAVVGPSAWTWACTSATCCSPGSGPGRWATTSAPPTTPGRSSCAGRPSSPPGASAGRPASTRSSTTAGWPGT